MNHETLHAQYIATKVDGIVEPYAVVDDKAFRYLKKHSEEVHQSVTFLGYTHKSSHICKALKEAGIEMRIFEVDETRYEEAKSDGFDNVVFIHQEHHKMPELINTIAVCAMNEEAMNVYYAITLRANGFQEVIVSLSDSKEDNRKLLLAGVSEIFDMYEESANQFIEMIENPESESKDT
jgi:Trk K+ transport system NAD-binding subunit